MIQDAKNKKREEEMVSKANEMKMVSQLQKELLNEKLEQKRKKDLERE